MDVIYVNNCVTTSATLDDRAQIIFNIHGKLQDMKTVQYVVLDLWFGLGCASLAGK